MKLIFQFKDIEVSGVYDDLAGGMLPVKSDILIKFGMRKSRNVWRSCSVYKKITRKLV